MLDENGQVQEVHLVGLAKQVGAPSRAAGESGNTAGFAGVAPMVVRLILGRLCIRYLNPGTSGEGPEHLGPHATEAEWEAAATAAMEDQDELSQKFMAHLRSPEVQNIAREKLTETEAWLRCIGLRRHHTGRRDETLWRKEVDKRVEYFLERSTTPLQKRDFDFRVKRFMHEFCIHSNVVRVSEALAMVETSTAGKSRDDVRSWPAYIATLLRRWDPKLYEVLADRDRRSRIDQKKGKKGEEGEAEDDPDEVETELRYGDRQVPPPPDWERPPGLPDAHDDGDEPVARALSGSSSNPSSRSSSPSPAPAVTKRQNFQ